MIKSMADLSLGSNDSFGGYVVISSYLRRSLFTSRSPVINAPLMPVGLSTVTWRDFSGPFSKVLPAKMNLCIPSTPIWQNDAALIRAISFIIFRWALNISLGACGADGGGNAAAREASPWLTGARERGDEVPPRSVSCSSRNYRVQ